MFFFQSKQLFYSGFRGGPTFFGGGGGGGGSTPTPPIPSLDPRMTRKLKKTTQNTDVNIQHSIYLYISFFANYIILKQCSMFTQKKKLVASISRG